MANFVFNNIPVATACFMTSPTNSAEYVFTGCNPAFVSLFGADVTGLTFSDLPLKLHAVHGDNSGAQDKNLPTRKDFALILNTIIKNVKCGVSHFVFSDNIRSYNISLSFLQNSYTVCIDAAECADYAMMNQLRLALKSIPTGIIVTSCDNGSILYMNLAAHELTGWGEEAVGIRVSEVLCLYSDDSKNPFDIFSPEFLQITHGINSKCFIFKNKSGRTSSINMSVNPITSPGNQESFVILFSDAGSQRMYENEITYLSFHDKLTGLYNRAYFEKKLKEFDKSSYYPVSIIMGDANGLKMTNDIFGHSQGDMILITIANILSLACRETDIVARYGGDEFVVLMPNTPIDEASKVCKNILNLCGQQNDKSMVSISLGYASKQYATESMNDTLNIAENFMYRHKLLESRSYRSSVISSLKKMLFEKSFETEEHATRLTSLCADAGRLLGLSQSQLNDLELFSMLHDIGKIGVNDQVLLKPGKLTETEWVEMRKHCEVGYRIAQSAPELAHIAEFILCHHEHYDGSGYPQRLKGEQIPLLSRILAVADSYDAMVNDRYYRKALSKDAAIAELKRCTSTQFDPDIVKVFLEILEPHPPNLRLLPTIKFA